MTELDGQPDTARPGVTAGAPRERTGARVGSLPNILTYGRILAIPALVACFFATGDWGRWTAMWIFIVAGVSDFLDGYLARRWKVEGTFGRVVDPFVDKVLVLGAFIFFAGKNFIIPETAPEGHMGVVKTISGVVPFMVVIILARELLVTSFRGLGESSGQAFGAAFSGKLKMVVQSVTILVILLYVNYFYRFEKGSTAEHYARVFRDVCIWVTILVTVWSGLLYVQRARSIYNA